MPIYTKKICSNDKCYLKVIRLEYDFCMRCFQREVNKNRLKKIT